MNAIGHLRWFTRVLNYLLGRLLSDLFVVVKFAHEYSPEGHKALAEANLREPNVLRHPEGGAVLIDFYWCGMAEKARYPNNILMGVGGMPCAVRRLDHQGARRSPFQAAYWQI